MNSGKHLETENFNYIGPTPDYKYYSFNGKTLLKHEDYLPLVKNNWNFVNELKAYNIQDCVVLYNIMSKFDQLIRSTFNFNMHNKGGCAAAHVIFFSF